MVQTASKQTSKYDKFKPKAAPDPELIYGKDITGDVIAISEISEELGEVVIQGMVDSSDIRELKTGNSLLFLILLILRYYFRKIICAPI